MKQLILILAMFICVSSRGQGYMNTSINIFGDTSLDAKSFYQSSFLLPGGNIICAFGNSSSLLSDIVKINIHGDTVKAIQIPQNSYYIYPVADNLFFCISYNKLITYDTNLNVVSMNFPKFKSYNPSGQYISKKFEFLGTKYLKDTFSMLLANLTDSSIKDSFIVIIHEIQDTGTNFSIYDFVKLKGNMGRIIIGSCDYLKPPNKPANGNVYIALIDDSGHTKWKHKSSSDESLGSYLVAYTDSSITLVTVKIKDTTRTNPRSQLFICTINVTGDTIRNEMIKDSVGIPYPYRSKKETVLLARDYNNKSVNHFLAIDSNGILTKSIKRQGYLSRYPSSIIKDNSYGWIETGRVYPDTSNSNVVIYYIAHLDSVFCTYTQPDFNLTSFSGASTVSYTIQLNSLFIDSIQSYSWYIDHTKTDSILTNSVNFKDTGDHTFTLKITNKSGCESMLEKTLHLSFPVAAGITNLTKNDYLSVLNNPFNNELTIIYTGNEKTDIKLCDIAGRVVGKMALNGAGLYNMNTTELNQGVYYLYNSVNNQSYMPIKVLKVD